MWSHGVVVDTTDDEIDLRDLVVTLWAGKVLIFAMTLAAFAAAAGYLHIAERKYSVKLTLRPVFFGF
ncbi:MAG: hypothetical protein EBV97_03510 [Rhodobacteraceae bacterium]|nr:hypothetical protein [Paracoccaceae bacterium]